MFMPSNHLHGKWWQTAKHLTKTRARHVFQRPPKKCRLNQRRLSIPSLRTPELQGEAARGWGRATLSPLHCILNGGTHVAQRTGVTSLSLAGHVVATSFPWLSAKLDCSSSPAHLRTMFTYVSAPPSFYPPIETRRLFTRMEHIAGESVRVSSTHCSLHWRRALSRSESPLRE